MVAAKWLSKTGPSQADLPLLRDCLLTSMSRLEMGLQQSGVAHWLGMEYCYGALLHAGVCNVMQTKPAHATASCWCRFMMLREMADRQRVKNQHEVKFGGESGPEVPTKKKRKKFRRRRPFLSRPGLTDEQKVEWLQSHSKVSDGQQ